MAAECAATSLNHSSNAAATATKILNRKTARALPRQRIVEPPYGSPVEDLLQMALLTEEEEGTTNNINNNMTALEILLSIFLTRMDADESS